MAMIKVLETDSPEYKSQAWREIQSISPDMAEFIKTISSEFGKPQNITVEELA